MSWVEISNLFLWVGFIGMALVNWALLRQIGVLYERVAPAGALSINKEIEAGQKAPELRLQSIDGELVNIGGTRKLSQLLFFLSPDCPICKTLLPALKSVAQAESDWVELVLGSDGTQQNHSQFVKTTGLSQFPYIVSELLGKSYGVAKLPYAVLIDDKGIISSMGIINSREHLDSLFEAREHQVASIQEYLSKPQLFEPQSNLKS